MEKKQINITGFGMNGEGVARVDGKVIFVDNAVVGDEVIVEIVKENKNFNQAKIVEVVKASPNRCQPKCKYYGVCGGCNMQHMNYETSLMVKTSNIESLFNKAKLNVKVLSTLESENIFAYRNKLTLYISQAKNLAFYKRNSKDLIEINNCELVSDSFNNIINKLNNFLSKNMEFNPSVIKGLSIREINDVYIFNFILNKKINFIKLENYFKLNKIKYSLNYCINSKNNSNIPLEPTIFVGGQKEVVLNEFDIEYPVYPLSFLQVNNKVKTKIYNHILSLIGEGKKVLDAYSGAGLLSAIMAKKSKIVYAIEINESAHMACGELVKKNKIKNLYPILGDCKVKIPELLQTEIIDIIVLDPARKGVDFNSLESIVKANAEKIIYLSCNPATLVRDLKFITENAKYRINLVQPYDMFPNTSEVETLVELIRE